MKIKLNGNEVNFPTMASELTLKQLFELRQATSPIEEICALVGLDKNTVSNFKSMETVRRAQALMIALGEDMKNGFGGGPLPDKVFIGGKMIKVPKDLKLEPVGAWMNVHNILAEKRNENLQANLPEDFTDCIPKTLAHYFYAQYHKGENYSEVAVEDPAWMEKVLQLNVSVAIPIANYFFLRFPALP